MSQLLTPGELTVSAPHGEMSARSEIRDDRKDDQLSQLLRLQEEIDETYVIHSPTGWRRGVIALYLLLVTCWMALYGFPSSSLEAVIFEILSAVSGAGAVWLGVVSFRKRAERRKLREAILAFESFPSEEGPGLLKERVIAQAESGAP